MSAARVQIAVVVMIVALSTRADADPPELLDEGTATLLSIAGTAGPLLTLGAASIHVAASSELTSSAATLGILSIAGLYALPSAGHWYSGKGWTPGLTIRTIGMVVAGLGLAKEIDSAGCHCFCDDSNGNFWVMGIGGGIVLGGAAYDIATAASRARSVNARMQLAVTPVPMPGGGGVSVFFVF